MGRRGAESGASAARAVPTPGSNADALQGVDNSGKEGAFCSEHGPEALFPASSPWVTAVGATRFVNQTIGMAEMATDQFGSGGGFSTRGRPLRACASPNEPLGPGGWTILGGLRPPRPPDLRNVGCLPADSVAQGPR